MSTKQPANIPITLSQARRQLDLRRSQQLNKRTWLTEVAGRVLDSLFK